MTPGDVIKLSSVAKYYGDLKAVDDVSFKISQGEFVALLGPNGAGKSTVFKLILGLVNPTRGHVHLLGSEAHRSGFDKVKNGIGFLPEQVLFHGALSGRETLVFYTKLKGGRLKAIDKLLDRVGLSKAADRRVATYSKGMRQRLALAQSLIGNPCVLILDEPTSGLDPFSRTTFFEIIDEVRAEGVAILMSSHALAELEKRTSRVVILNDGKLVANGTVSELKANISLNAKIKISAGPEEMKQLASELSNDYGAENFINGVALLECSDAEKMALLKTLMSSGVHLDGVKIDEPGLERVFAAYTHGDQLK